MLDFVFGQVERNWSLYFNLLQKKRDEILDLRVVMLSFYVS